MSDKLRAAAKRPLNWDMPSLLNAAADMLDELVKACKAANSGKRAADLLCEMAVEKAEDHK